MFTKLGLIFLTLIADGDWQDELQKIDSQVSQLEELQERLRKDAQKNAILRLAQKCEFGPRQSLGVQLFFRGLYLFDTTLGKTVEPRELSRGSKFTFLGESEYNNAMRWQFQSENHREARKAWDLAAQEKQKIEEIQGHLDTLKERKRKILQEHGQQ